MKNDFPVLEFRYCCDGELAQAEEGVKWFDEGGNFVIRNCYKCESQIIWHHCLLNKPCCIKCCEDFPIANKRMAIERDLTKRNTRVCHALHLRRKEIEIEQFVK